jgi:hypothetical protein
MALGIDVWAHHYDFPSHDHTAVGYLAGADPGIEIMVLSSLRVLFCNHILIVPLRRCLLPFGRLTLSTSLGELSRLIEHKDPSVIAVR